MLPPLAHFEVPLNIGRQNYTIFVFSHLSVSVSLLICFSGLCEQMHWLFKTPQQHQGLFTLMLLRASILSLRVQQKETKLSEGSGGKVLWEAEEPEVVEPREKAAQGRPDHSE